MSKISNENNVKKFELFSEQFSCIICNVEKFDLRDFTKDHLRRGKVENFMYDLVKCFNIQVFNPQHDIRDAKICRTCIRHLREALSFRKLVRAAQQRLQDNVVLLNSSQTIKIEYPDDPLDTESDNLPLKYNADDTIKDDIKFSSYIDDSDNKECLFKDDISDGESSTTSEQMKIATGCKDVKEEIARELPVPILEPSCRTCPTCSKTYKTFKLLKLHYDSHFVTYLCHFCGLSYNLKISYSSHMQRHSDKIQSCELCKKIYPTTSSLRRHIRTFHNKEKIFACNDCDEKYSTQVARRKHIYRKHPDNTKVKIFPCHICGRVYFGCAILKSHIRVSHQKIKKYCCAICNKSFETRYQMEYHVVTHRGRIKEFTCEQCGKSYTHKSTFSTHLKIHSNPTYFKCDKCDKSYYFKRSLIQHMKVHTENYNSRRGPRPKNPKDPSQARVKKNFPAVQGVSQASEVTPTIPLCLAPNWTSR